MSLFDQYTASAKIVDGMLILSLLDAVQPVVWQMELGQAKSSAIEIRNNQDGTHTLYLKTPRNDIQEIAQYASKNNAVKALAAVTRALERAHGQLRPLPDPTTMAHGFSNNQLPVVLPSIKAPSIHWPRLPSFTTIIKIGGALFLILILIFLVSLPAPKPFKTFETNSNAPSSTTATQSTEAPMEKSIETGTPVSADDFLNQAE